MARLKSIIAICTILCCLNLPIHAFNMTRSFYAKSDIEYLFASSNDRLFAISFEADLILLIAVDGGNDSNVCSLLSSPIVMSSEKKQVKTLGNGKLVISAQTGKDEHLGGKVHSYIIVDPFDCTSLVEFKSVGGVVVPYYDSFDIIYWNSMLKPQRRDDKGKLIRLEKRIDETKYDKHNVQTIKPFDDSEGYICEGQKLLSLDLEMKPKAEYSLHEDQKLSIDYGKATTCYSDRHDGHVCEMLNAKLKVQATVKLNHLDKARLRTVNNLPYGGAIVLRSVKISNGVEIFHATIINADGSITRTDNIRAQTVDEPKVHAFVFSNGEFCIALTGKNENSGRLFSDVPNFIVQTQYVDISEWLDYKKFLENSRIQKIGSR